MGGWLWWAFFNILHYDERWWTKLNITEFLPATCSEGSYMNTMNECVLHRVVK